MNKKVIIVIGIFMLLLIGIIINSNKKLEDINNISGIIAVENVSYKDGELYDSYIVTLNDNINSGEKIHQEFYTDKSWSLANGLAIKTPNLKIINE